MTEIWAQAALWLALALVASLLSIWLSVATTLSEIVVSTIAQLIIGVVLGCALLAGDATWIKFFSGAGAILLTFLAPHLRYYFGVVRAVAPIDRPRTVFGVGGSSDRQRGGADAHC